MKVELLSRLMKSKLNGSRGNHTTSEPSISLSVILVQAEIACQLTFRNMQPFIVLPKYRYRC